MAVPEVKASSRLSPASECWRSSTIQCLSAGKACKASSRLCGISGEGGEEPEEREEPRLSESVSRGAGGISVWQTKVMFNPGVCWIVANCRYATVLDWGSVWEG